MTKADTVTVDAGKADDESHPMRRCFRRSMLGLLVAASMPVSAAAQAPATSEDLARRQYEFGLESVKAGKYTEGLKDFEAVVDNYPASSAADEALLAIARYQLQVQRNPAAAQATAESVQKTVSGVRFSGHVVCHRRPGDGGQRTDARQRGSGARQLRPGAAAVPRVGRRRAGAGRRRRYAPASGPVSGGARSVRYGHDGVSAVVVGVSGAALGRRCLAMGGRPLDAMQELQRVILAAPGSPEAQQARTLNTIVYRLYVRPPAQSPYVFSGNSIAGPTGKLKDVSAIAFGPDGSLFVTSKTGVIALSQKGATVRSIAAVEPRAMFVDAQGRVLAAQKALLVQDAAPDTVDADADRAARRRRRPRCSRTSPRWPCCPPASASSRTAASAACSGSMLPASTSDRSRPFAPAASRLARSSRLPCWISDNKTVAVLDRTGKTIQRIADEGDRLRADESRPMSRSTCWGTSTCSTESPCTCSHRTENWWPRLPAATKTLLAALREGTALALDQAARMYIYDDRAERVQIYQ